MKRFQWLLAAMLAAFSASALSVVYEEDFVTSESYSAGSAQYDNWVTFTGQLGTGVWRSITLSGSNDTTGLSCSDPAVVTQIAAALADTSASESFSCEGNDWNVGECSIEGGAGTPRALGVNQGACSCGNGYSLRPAIANSNWGGINSLTCSGPSQTMRLELVQGEAKSVPALPPIALAVLLALVAGLGTVLLRRRQA